MFAYQNGKLIGHAENQSVKSANRIQCFMLSSILSNNRDMVSLVPRPTRFLTRPGGNKSHVTTGG